MQVAYVKPQVVVECWVGQQQACSQDLASVDCDLETRYLRCQQAELPFTLSVPDKGTVRACSHQSAVDVPARAGVDCSRTSSVAWFRARKQSSCKAMCVWACPCMLDPGYIDQGVNPSSAACSIGPACCEASSSGNIGNTADAMMHDASGLLQVAGVLYYFPFQAGSETLPVEDNPLLAEAGEEGPTQSEMGPVTQDSTQAADGMSTVLFFFLASGLLE